MIVKMNSNVSKEQLDSFEKIMKEKGYDVCCISKIPFIVEGILGDTRKLQTRDIERLDGVESVTRIQTPYKMVNKNFKEGPTRIKIKNWTIGDGSFTVIAGPCSVESVSQIDEISKAVAASGAHILRGGTFKPRTSPYAFQGLEEEGLKLLYEAGQKTGLPVISEISSPEYIPMFLKYVDIIQVGARNMQNYALLKALSKVNKPVLLKRASGATIEEWLLSAEYLMVGGNEQVILCERGIRTFETYTRNTLDLSAVLAVHELSHLPVIVDPSHACGRYTMVDGLSKAALAAGADGIMVEVHNHPEIALSDGAQSLKIEPFEHMMKDLKELSPMFQKKM